MGANRKTKPFNLLFKKHARKNGLLETFYVSVFLSSCCVVISNTYQVALFLTSIILKHGVDK